MKLAIAQMVFGILLAIDSLWILYVLSNVLYMPLGAREMLIFGLQFMLGISVFLCGLAQARYLRA